MSKKIILLVVLAISVFSVIVIAVWGTLPESSSDTSLTSVSFENYDTNDSGDKIIDILGIVTEDDPYYTLEYTFLPDDASTDFTVTSSSDDVTVLIDPLDQEVFVTFSIDAIGTNVTITITDENTNESDEITLIFKVPDIIVSD